MALRGVARILGLGVLAVGLSGCALFGVFRSEEREPWRAAVAEHCRASGAVQPSAFVRPRRSVEGPGICGVEQPFTVTAGSGGAVAFSAPAILDCPMVAGTDRWIDGTVQPAAYALFGQPVVSLTIAGSYACRGRNGASKGPLSEHAFANALDVSAFTLADGRTITVLDGWGGAGDEQTFLRAAHRGACTTFSTVIGPDGDRHHRDHLHLDLARYGRQGKIHRYCG